MAENEEVKEKRRGPCGIVGRQHTGCKKARDMHRKWKTDLSFRQWLRDIPHPGTDIADSPKVRKILKGKR